jgi:hypothetical protein
MNSKLMILFDDSSAFIFFRTGFASVAVLLKSFEFDAFHMLAPHVEFVLNYFRYTLIYICIYIYMCVCVSSHASVPITARM